MNNQIGDRIKQLRKIHGFSQQELADKLGCTRQTVTSSENNTVVPPLYRLDEIANILGVPTILLMFDEVPAESFDSFQIIQQIKTDLYLFELLITSAVSTDTDYVFLPRRNNDIEELPKAIRIDDLLDVLEQSRNMFKFLSEQKSFDYLLSQDNTQED